VKGSEFPRRESEPFPSEPVGGSATAAPKIKVKVSPIFRRVRDSKIELDRQLKDSLIAARRNDLSKFRAGIDTTYWVREIDVI
jgi:hypothetical protein